MGAVGKSVPILSTIEGEHELNQEMAEKTIEDAEYNARQRMRQADITKGEQVSATAVNGMALEGSITDRIEEDYANAYKEAQNIIYTGKLKAYQMKRSSQLARQKGYQDIAMKGGMLAMKGGA